VNLSQLDLQGNPIAQVAQDSGNLPSPGRLAVMAATGADLRLLLVMLIALQIPVSDLLHAAGC
jgi:hypothetical protein